MCAYVYVCECALHAWGVYQQPENRKSVAIGFKGNTSSCVDSHCYLFRLIHLHHVRHCCMCLIAQVSDSDPICTAALCRGCDVLVLACSDGHALAFPASEVPVKGRSGAGFVKVCGGSDIVLIMI